LTDPSGCPERPRSAAPDDLGFRPRPMVRWLDPGPLLAKEIKGAISGLFGSHADRREMQAALTPPAGLDYSDRDDLWFDYAADTGDGFGPAYAIASLMGRTELRLPRGGLPMKLPRGRFLVLGGDAVYPAASERQYRDRFLGPFGAAFPCAAEPPDLYAVPGNHDWYDGLTGFLRLFCQGQWVGGWRTRQTRSYFALRLAHRWWLWAIDISFDRFIDQPQLAYFRELARSEVRPGDRLVLCTAKPSWVHAGMAGDEAYKSRLEARRNLEYFERTVIRPSGARLVLTLSGDLHHYARYANSDGTRMKVTSGGGGAYLYPTHGLPNRFSWPAPEGTEDYSLATTYPSPQRSRAMRGGVLLALFRNRGFWATAGLLQLLLVWMVQFGLRRPDRSVAAAFHQADLARLLFALLRFPPGLILALVMVAALIGFADARGWGRLALGGVHGLIQVALPLVVAWGVSRIELDGAPFMAILLATVAVGGGFGASLLMGLYLLAASVFLGRHPNEVFAAQGIGHHKGFLRIHLGDDGRLTVYPIGLDRVPRRWRLVAEGDPGAPWFEPAGGTIEPHLIEEPFSLA
jgi:hypothetical protein